MLNISFEFFPPKTIDASFKLANAVSKLAPFSPEFVSVTYGAGGTTRKLTHDAVEAIGRNYDLDVAAHLTCVEATRAETLDISERYAQAGVSKIVALRGDPSNGASNFTATRDGFASSVDLVSALAKTGKFDVIVGAYPESHPDAANQRANIDWLKAKIDAGASSAITQFFFEAETFLRFRDACADAGIDAPIVPGILPINNWSRVRNFATKCGASIPAMLDRAFDNAAKSGQERLLATAQCSELCDRLMNEGVEQLHFYTLNTPTLTRDVITALGVTPANTLRKVA